MLNLSPIFQDAIDVLSGYASQLKLPALPATVFLMQQDVVNHYRYAVTHYLPLTLNEYFLQNSSIGTPYEKWAKFTNDDFQQLSFTVTNLIRYTVRLIHESESIAMVAEHRYEEASARSNAYISPLVEIDHRGSQIGIYVNPDQSLSVTPFSTKTSYPGHFGMRSEADGKTEWWHTTTHSDGIEVKRFITKAEYQELTRTLYERVEDLQDRSVLEHLKSDGLKECDELTALTEQFAALCSSYYDEHKVATVFENLHQSWWL